MSEQGLKGKWPLVKLVDCARIVSGATPKTSEPQYWDGDINWVTPKDISDLDGYPFLDSTPRTLTAEGLASSSAEILPARSVLLSSRAPIGLVAINRIPVATNQGFKSFVPDASRLDAGFLYHWLRANRSFLENLGTGATFKEISKTVMTRVEIPLPPLDTQKRIAAVLDKADALRRQRQESILLTETFLESVFMDMFGDPAANPKGWPSESLGNLVVEGDTINYGVVQPGEDHPGGIALIRLADLANPDPQLRKSKQIDPAIEAAYGRSRLAGGELLIGCVGHTIGVSCIAPKEWAGANIARAVARVRLRPGIPAEFVLQQVRTPAVQRFFTAELRVAGQPTLNIKQIKETSILLPPPELRDRFALIYIKAQESHAEKTQSAVFSENLFFALQQRAFLGELNLSNLFLEEDVVAIERAADRLHQLVNVTLPKSLGTKRAKRAFVASPEIESTLKAQDASLEKGEPIAWSEDYFQHRILGRILEAPYCFPKIWEAVEQRMPEADYDIVKEKVFSYLADGTLRQRFDKKQKALVFFPRRA